jgi:SAM-dependent methyltransferase
MNRLESLDNLNKNTYARSEVLQSYADLDFLFKPEEVLFDKLHTAIKDKKILDIGIGGGRTTGFLLQLSKDYIGIDYIPGFVEIAKSRYNNATILCCDARDLSPFEDCAFDFVLISFNSLDHIDHEDRLKALREIYRVLRPGGFFMFSTHNRDYRYFDKLPWQEDIRFDLMHLKSCLYSLLFLPRHLMMRKRSVYTDEYAIINDNAHGYSLMIYYIGFAKQVKQLESIGFHSIQSYDMDGVRVDSDTRFPWTYFITQR